MLGDHRSSGSIGQPGVRKNTKKNTHHLSPNLAAIQATIKWTNSPEFCAMQMQIFKQAKFQLEMEWYAAKSPSSGNINE